MASYINFIKLKSSDSEAMSQLLLDSPQSYIQYFQPFDFQTTSIRKILETAEKDIFLGVKLQSESNQELVGFYMLRGLDEGYDEPMYGVFISNKYMSKGIARLTIQHAECLCKMNSYKRLLLKVHLENPRAKRLYESLGFKFLRENPSNKNIVLYKNIDKSDV
jgi:ribosomal protein S18 acetylase RimI-like enzyme